MNTRYDLSDLQLDYVEYIMARYDGYIDAHYDLLRVSLHNEIGQWTEAELIQRVTVECPELLDE